MCSIHVLYNTKHNSSMVQCFSGGLNATRWFASNLLTCLFNVLQSSKHFWEVISFLQQLVEKFAIGRGGVGNSERSCSPLGPFEPLHQNSRHFYSFWQRNLVSIVFHHSLFDSILELAEYSFAVHCKLYFPLKTPCSRWHEPKYIS